MLSALELGLIWLPHSIQAAKRDYARRSPRYRLPPRLHAGLALDRTGIVRGSDRTPCVVEGRVVTVLVDVMREKAQPALVDRQRRPYVECVVAKRRSPPDRRLRVYFDAGFNPVIEFAAG